MQVCTNRDIQYNYSYNYSKSMKQAEVLLCYRVIQESY